MNPVSDYFGAIANQFLYISFALLERLRYPVQGTFGKSTAKSAEEFQSLRTCKSYAWLFPYALQTLGTVPVPSVHPTVIESLRLAFVEELKLVAESSVVTKRVDAAREKYPTDAQHRFVYLANEAVQVMRIGCQSGKTMRLTHLATNSTSKKNPLGISVSNKGAYGMDAFVDATSFYLKSSTLQPSQSSRSSQIADEYQRRLHALRGPLDPAGASLSGPALADYYQRRLDELRGPVRGGARTLRRRKQGRRTRRR